jgi:tetratricopeptide (TPR) repeat protein
MELVRGMKITEYCDEAKLSTHARLDLFIQVCQAIQHAHQKGIIHRDIKPSNLLVTVNDGVPVPKVIDFGIAKATSGQQLTDKTIYTAFEQFIGTPAYMSPEQALLTSLDIDTRSDIYALGVLLYELLTGKTPFDAKELLAIGLDEIRRTICELEPQRPSTRLSTLAQNELSTTAQRRGLDAPKLVSELRGDLDWIVMKALEKDRARRYETANGLAADVQRHLNNEPVVACPPSKFYRIRKTVRRNKLAFTAVTAVLTSLVLGFTFSTILFLRERTARRQADEQRAIAKAVSDFLQKDLLRQAGSDAQVEAHFTPDPNLTVREALDRAAKRIDDQFKNHPLQEVAVRTAIGNGLIAVGEPERAVSHFQKCVELARATLGPGHQNTLHSMNSLAIAYNKAGKVHLALPLYEETLKRRKAKLGPDHRDTLGSMNNLAVAYAGAGQRDQALLLSEETLRLMKAKLRPDDPFTLNAMLNLANRYRDDGKLDQAVPLFEETLKLRKAKLGTYHPETLTSLYNLEFAYRKAGKLDQALTLQEKTAELMKAELGPEHRETLKLMDNLALVYRASGKLDQAQSLFSESVKLRRATQGPNHPDTLRSMHHLADTLVRAKNYTEAEVLYRDALSQVRPLSSNTPPQDIPLLGVILHHLAIVLWERNIRTEAHSLAEEAMTLYYHHAEWPGNERQHAFEVLASMLEELGEMDKLDATRREYIDRLRNRYARDPLKLAERLYTVADLSYRQDNFAVAEPLYREIVQHRRAGLKADHKDVLDATANLARLLSDWAWAERNQVGRAIPSTPSVPSDESGGAVKTPRPASEQSRAPVEMAREAERLLREVLAVWPSANASWRVGDVKSRLGGALIAVAATDPAPDPEGRVANLSQAESLLLESLDQLQKTAAEGKFKGDALQRLVRLYEAWNKPDKRAEWEQKFDRFSKGQDNSLYSQSDTPGSETN